MMMSSLSFLLLATVAASLFSSSADAFAPSAASATTTTTSCCRQLYQQSTVSLFMAVVDIDGEAAFDKTIQNAGDSLVVVDYSTTWWGGGAIFACITYWGSIFVICSDDVLQYLTRLLFLAVFSLCSRSGAALVRSVSTSISYWERRFPSSQGAHAIFFSFFFFLRLDLSGDCSQIWRIQWKVHWCSIPKGEPVVGMVCVSGCDSLPLYTSRLLTLIVNCCRWLETPLLMPPNWWSGRVYDRCHPFTISWMEKRWTSSMERMRRPLKLPLQNTSNKKNEWNAKKRKQHKKHKHYKQTTINFN